MKKNKTMIVATLAFATLAAEAQTLNIIAGGTTYKFPAAQTGSMTYGDGGQQITVMGRTFSVADITAMYVDQTDVTDNLVTITYNGTQAPTITVAGNVARYVTPTVSGAHVAIAQSNTADVDGDEITYQLEGTTTDGSLTLSGSYKCTVALAGVTLTNPSGAALNITNSKRIQLAAKSGTASTLTDGSDGSQKACIYSKGQLQLQGNGTLSVAGRTKHAIKSASYIEVKNLTLNVTASVGDGINCEEYFLMKSGNVTLTGVGDDGLQCDLGGTTSTGETTDHDDEDSGNIYLQGGTLTVTTTAAATKGVKAEGDVNITGGTISVTTTGGGAWDSDDLDTKAACGLSADGDMNVSGGTLTLSSSGAGGKCMKCDGTMTVSDGAVISAKTTGAKYSYTYGGTSYSSSPKALKAGVRTEGSSASSRADAPGGGGWGPGGGGGWGPGGGGQQASYTYSGGMVFTGGTVSATSKNHEAIESKSTITVSGGYVYAEGGDDAINSASTFTISGGYVMGNSTGNDGLDANGNFDITGGIVFAVATTQPEVGIDANTEGGYKLTISGGSVVAIGGFENSSTTTGMSTKSVSYSKGQWYTLSSGSTKVLTFKVPQNGSMGSGMTLCTKSTPAVATATQSGTTFWNGYGCTAN